MFRPELVRADRYEGYFSKQEVALRLAGMESRRARPSRIGFLFVTSIEGHFVKRSLIVLANFTPPRSFNTLSLAKYMPLDTGIPEL